MSESFVYSSSCRGSSNRPQRRLVIAVLVAGAFLMGTTEFIMAGILPEIALDFHTTVARAGLTVTFYALGMIVGAPGVSLATLNFSRRLTLTLALGLFVVCHAVIVVTGSFAIVLIMRTLTGVATGAFWAVGSAVAAAVTDADMRSRALGMVLGGGMLANVLGVPLGSFAGQTIGWRATFGILAGLTVLVSIATAASIRGDSAGPPGRSIGTELLALQDGRIWLVLGASALLGCGVLSIYTYLVPLMRQAGLSDATTPFVLAGFGIMALVGIVGGGRLGDKHPYRTITASAAATVLAAAGLAVFGRHQGALLVFFFVLGLVGLSANPVLVSLAVHFGGRAEAMPTAMSSSVFNLGTAVGTGVAGAALETTLGTLAPPIIGAAAAAMIFIPIGLLVLVDRRASDIVVVSE